MAKLTFGMAHYLDFYGVHLTIQSARIYHDCRDVEFLIIDNSPGSDHSKELNAFAQSIAGATNIRVIPFTGAVGTTQSREAIFAEAQGDIVLVTDCHVQLAADGITRLIQYLSDPSKTGLYHGPLLMDDLAGMSTHLSRTWGEYMYGQWGLAWCRENYIGSRLDVAVVAIEKDDKATFHYMDMIEGKVLEPVKGLPVVAWHGHQHALWEHRYVPMGQDPNQPPFPISGHGLGLFACRKDSWVGFNPNFREFGGEELYIHDKFRALGREVTCLPFLKWVHRWGRVGGARYPRSIDNQLRNNILGRLELAQITGKDPYVDDIHHHYVNEMKFPHQRFLAVLQDPFKYTPSQPAPDMQSVIPATKVNTNEPPVSNLGLPLPKPEKLTDLTSLSDWCASVKRDLNEHAEAISACAYLCNHVTEVTKRRESTLFILGSAPHKVVSYHEEADTVLDIAKWIMTTGREKRHVEWTLHVGPVDVPPPDIEPTDMLFIDTRHNAARARKELALYGGKVSKFIIFHDTESNGMVGDDGKDGLWSPIRSFVNKNKEWFVCHHSPKQYGLTILTTIPEFRPKIPILPWPPACGTGTHLKRVLARLGIHAEQGCSCIRRAIAMDRNGVEWCVNNRTTIEKWLDEEAKARKKDASPAAISAVVEYAIRRAQISKRLGLCPEGEFVASGSTIVRVPEPATPEVIPG